MILGARAAAVLSVGASFVALAVALATASGVVALAAVVVSAVALLSLFRSEDTALDLTRTGADRLMSGGRMLLVAAVLVRAADAAAGAAYAACAAVILGAWSLVGLFIVAMSTRHPAYGVRNIAAPTTPTLLAQPAGKARLAATVFTVLDVLAVAAIVVGGANAGATPWIAVGIVVAVAAGVVAWMILPPLRSHRAARSSALVASLTELAPQAVVHLSGEARKPPYILGQWLAALEAANLRTFILLREATQLQTLPPSTLPVVLAKTGRDVARLVVPSVRVAFYLANGSVNGDLLREPLVRHVFLNHGDSDKSTSANPFNRVYNELWVAGQAAVDRYRAAGIDLPDDAFTIVGRPQLAALSVGPRPDADQTTVLYAPTFEGYFEQSNYSSLESMGPAIVAALLERRPAVRIIFKAHPSTGHQRPGMRRAAAEVERMLRAANAAGGSHVVVGDASALSLYDAFTATDVLISDVSSVLTDFLWTERPLLATNPRRLAYHELVARFPSHRAGYILDPQTDVGALLDTALGDDPKAEDRRQVRDYVLGNPPGGPLQAFVDAADRAYATAVEHAAAVENTFSFSQS